MGDAYKTRPSLLARLRTSTDEEAWREFDDRYRELVLRYCRLRGLQASDADDVRQLVMFRLVDSMKRFEYDPARGRFHHYLGTVVGHAITRFKNNKQNDPAPAGTRDEAAPDFVASEWEREWENYHIRRALSTLQQKFERKSLAVFERLLDGATTEAAAREFECSTDAIHKIRQRVRAEMEAIIALQIREEEET